MRPKKVQGKNSHGAKRADKAIARAEIEALDRQGVVDKVDDKGFFGLFQVP